MQVCWAWLAAGGWMLWCVGAIVAADRPNVVLINVDDLGYGDIGPYGNTTQQTPHLDRMAAEGRRLTSHYAAPVCSPSRASLMTGCYPKRVLATPHVLFPASRVGLHPDEVTIADMLKEIGYATACIGKWHLGDQPEFLPTRQGFDYYYGLPYSNDMGPPEDGAKSNYGQPLPKAKSKPGAGLGPEDGIRGAGQPPLPWLENETVLERVRGPQQELLVQRYTEKAVEFIRQHRDQPFFVYLPHSAVHFPLYPSARFRGTSNNGLFGDWVTEVDWSVGEILKTLDDLGLAERTLVIFTSDNGGQPRHGANNAPLRGGKGSTWEGGIRVPTICRWPGKIPAGTSTTAITTMMDILPTIAHLTGAQLPNDRRIDGVNVWSVMSGQIGANEDPPRQDFLYFRGFELQAVRRGPWKLSLKYNALYNLDDDIGETTDVQAEHPDIVAELTRLAESVDGDLGRNGIGPGCRPLGRVEQARPLLDW
ncbi:MAG: arylsulfatase [Planctomycetota bacterium]|nr:MAG: arylsulfatase [Planctomycetota bacterium]